MTILELINIKMMEKHRLNKTEKDLVKIGFNQGYVSAMDNLRHKSPSERKAIIDNTFKSLERFSKNPIPDYDVEKKSLVASLKGKVAAISDLKQIEAKFGNNVYGIKKTKK